MPCVPITDGTHLQPGVWVERLVTVRQAQNDVGGRLFQRKLLPPKLMEFEDDFCLILEKVQASTDLIEPEVDVRDKYGILRSLRRGLTAHARNMEVPENLLKTINRWRTEAESASGNPRLDMEDVYATLKSLLPTLLRFSSKL